MQHCHILALLQKPLDQSAPCRICRRKPANITVSLHRVGSLDGLKTNLSDDSPTYGRALKTPRLQAAPSSPSALRSGPAAATGLFGRSSAFSRSLPQEAIGERDEGGDRQQNAVPAAPLVVRCSQFQQIQPCGLFVSGESLTLAVNWKCAVTARTACRFQGRVDHE